MFEFIPGKDTEYTKDEDHICDALLGFSVKTLSMNSLSSSGWKVEGTMTYAPGGSLNRPDNSRRFTKALLLAQLKFQFGFRGLLQFFWLVFEMVSIDT